VSLPPDVDPGEPELDPATGELTGTVIRGASAAGAGYVLTQLLTMGFYLVLARLATPDDFGQFAAASILVSAGLLFTESGMLAALIHRRDRLDEAASTATVSTALAGLAAAGISLAVSPLVGEFFGSSRIGALTAAMSGLLFLRSLQVVPEALLQRSFSFLRRIVVQPCQATAFGIAAVIATSNDLGPWGLVIGFYASAVTDIALSWTLVRWRPRLSQVSFATWRELISYGRHVLASNVVLRLGEQVPVALLGRFVGKSPLGQYRYADRMASTPFALVLAAAAYVIFPAFARISDDRRRFVRAFLESLRWFAAIAMPFGLILIPLGVPLAVTVFGDVWRDAGYAAMALSGYTVAASLIAVAAEALKAEGRPDVLVRVHAVTAVSGACFMAALLPLGLVGVALGFSLGSTLGAIYSLVRLTGILELRPQQVLAQLWPPALAAGLMSGAVLGLDRLLLDPASHATGPAVLLIAAEALFAALVYLIALHLLAPDTAGRVRELALTARRGTAPKPLPRLRG
jgi:O-antigen/teichoic acid export membrane protein